MSSASNDMKNKIKKLLILCRLHCQFLQRDNKT